MSRRETRVRWFVEFRGRGKGGTWQLWDVVPHRIGKPEEVKRGR
jgi:hypothetical protein